MTKDGVRDFIAAEYTLSENYVHGLAAFGPRLKKFRKPAFLPGLKPRQECGKFCDRSSNPIVLPFCIPLENSLKCPYIF